MENKSDDLNQDDGLPQPGTEEPRKPSSSTGSTDGPGNVSVDEPTQPTLDPSSPPPGGEDAQERDEGGEEEEQEDDEGPADEEEDTGS